MVRTHTVTTQLCEVEVCELKPKYQVKCCTKVYHLKTISDRRFKCYAKDKRALIVAQRTCDDGVLDYVSIRDSEDNDDKRLRLSLTM